MVLQGKNENHFSVSPIDDIEKHYMEKRYMPVINRLNIKNPSNITGAFLTS